MSAATLRPGRLLAKAGLAVATALAAAPLLVGTGALLWRGLPALARALGAEGPPPSGDTTGLLDALLGTLSLASSATLLAAPIGVLAAIRLRELPAEGRLAGAARWAIREAGGLPSVCVGLAGLALAARAAGLGVSPLAAALTLAALVLPGIIASSEEALSAAPDELREASLALGATRAQTLSRLVLPWALPGIAAGVLTAAARAAGATAPLLFALGAGPAAGLDRAAAALPARLFTLALDGGAPSREAAHATAAALVLLVLALHGAAALVRAGGAPRAEGRA